MNTIHVKTNEKRCEARAEYWEKDNKFFVRAWIGKRKKPSFFYRMNTEKSMIETRDNFITMYQDTADRSAKQRQLEKDFKHDLIVGDVLVSSWGWEQTNKDFYKVIALHGKKSISIVAISEDCNYDSHSMTGTKTPDVNIELPNVLSKKGIFGFYGIKINDYATARKWEGRPEHYSCYA
jgi:hypothetical protein